MTDQAHPATIGHPIHLDDILEDAALVREDETRISLALFLATEMVPRLVAEVRATREARRELAWALNDLMDWARRTHGGDPTLHPEEYYRTTEHAQRVLDDHDMGGQ